MEDEFKDLKEKAKKINYGGYSSSNSPLLTSFLSSVTDSFDKEYKNEKGKVETRKEGAFNSPSKERRDSPLGLRNYYPPSSINSLGSDFILEIDDSFERSRLIQREVANQRTLERLDSLKKAKKVSIALANKMNSTNSPANDLISELCYMISGGEVSKAKKIILKQLSTAKKRASLFEATDAYGYNILHLAVDSCPELIKPLIEKGMPLDKYDFILNLGGWNCLSYAAMKGDEATFELLLKLGAKPDQTCFHYFCSHFCSLNCEKLLVTLLKKGVDINAPPKNSITGDHPIHSSVVNAQEDKIAHLEGSTIMVELLTRYGASVNVTNYKGDTPLHWAIYTGKKKVAKILCAAGADLNIKGAEGYNALELACHIHTKMESTIRKIMEAINILTPLEFHTEEPREYILKKFIEEEIGYASFKGINFEILQSLGIKNSANIAVLLSVHDKIRSSITESPKSSARVGKFETEEDSTLSYENWANLIPIGTAKDFTSSIPFGAPEARRRLDQRLEKFKLKKYSDFNFDRHCLFSAFSLQLFETEEYSHIRKQASQWLLENSDWKMGNKNLSELVGSTYWEEYCKAVSMDSWGDSISLLAIVETFGCEVFLISSIRGTKFTVTLKPSRYLTKKLILIAHLEDIFFLPLTQVIEIPRFAEWNDDYAIDPKDLKLIKKIGEGTTGEIYEGLWKGTKVAAKKIYKHLLQGQDELNRFRSEVAMLKRFRYQHIVMFLGTLTDKEDLIIVTEYVQNSLSTFIKAYNASNLDWPLRIHIATQIAKGMNYLHGLRPRVIHRDLKSSNILIDSNFCVKICDFGVAKVLENAQFLQTLVSTIAWTAPEILHGRSYDEKVDVYSFSIVLWELLEAKLPYENLSEQQIILGVSSHDLRPSVPSWCHPKYLELMKACWNEEPSSRPSFEEIIMFLQTLASEFTSTLSSDEEIDSPLSTSPNENSPVTFRRERSQVVTSQYWEIDYDELTYTERDVIGRGRSAIVYKGFWREQEVAMKDTFIKLVLREIEDPKEFQKELEILAQIRSPNLVFFYGACLSPKNIIVTEYFPAGTLYDLMQNPNISFGWKEVIKYSKDIATGIHVLHNWKPPVVHRDIKSCNLLLDSKGDCIKICDLGLARFTTKSNDSTLKKCKGTPAYMAPEVYFASLEGEDLPSDVEMTSPSTKSDIFSLGIVYWEMASRSFFGRYRNPYFSDYKNIQHEAQILIQVAKKGLRPILHQQIPKALASLIKWCFEQHPGKRPTSQEVLERLQHIEKDYQTNKSVWNKCYSFNT